MVSLRNITMLRFFSRSADPGPETFDEALSRFLSEMRVATNGYGHVVKEYLPFELFKPFVDEAISIRGEECYGDDARRGVEKSLAAIIEAHLKENTSLNEAMIGDIIHELEYRFLLGATQERCEVFHGSVPDWWARAAL